MKTSTTSDIHKTRKTRDLDISKLTQEILGVEGNEAVTGKVMKKQVSQVLESEDKDAALQLLKTGYVKVYSYLSDTLKADTDIIKELVAQKADMHYIIPEKLKKDLSIQEIIMEGLLLQGGRIEEVIAFIEKKEKKTQKRLCAYIEEKIKSQTFSLGIIESLLFQAYLQDFHSYTILIESKLFQKTHNSYKLSELALKAIQESLGETDIDPSQILKTFLGKAIEKIPKEIIALIELVFSQVQIKKEKEEEKQETDDTLLQNDESDNDDTDEEEGPYPYPYTLQGSFIQLTDTSGIHVSIEEKIFENASEICIKNYIAFVSLLSELGLSFLVNNQYSKIQIATEVNFFEGEGMTGARVFKFLCSVGKNIGIPEDPEIDREGNKKAGYFHNLDSAKYHINKVNDSGKIGEYNFTEFKGKDKSIIELYMRAKGLLTPPFWELSIANWKK